MKRGGSQGQVNTPVLRRGSVVVVAEGLARPGVKAVGGEPVGQGVVG